MSTFVFLVLAAIHVHLGMIVFQASKSLMHPPELLKEKVYKYRFLPFAGYATQTAGIYVMFTNESAQLIALLMFFGGSILLSFVLRRVQVISAAEIKKFDKKNGPH